VAGTCECGNEPCGSVKCGEFLVQLRIGYPLKKDSAPWNKVVKDVREFTDTSSLLCD